jgi:hypothetical protein
MKKLFFSILMLLSFFSFGQSYFAFPDSDAFWSEYYYDNYDQAFYQIGIIGDTIIDSLEYHKLYYEDNCHIDTNISVSNAYYIGAIREDSLKRIFFYNHSYGLAATDSIYKLYDFSAQVGDTIKFEPFNWFYPYAYLVVDTIDSVMVYDHYRKRFHFLNDFGYETWIEGIGSLRGLLSTITPYPTCFCIWENVCYKYQNTTYYLNPPFLDCYEPYGDVKENNKQEENVNIYPNPANSTLYLEINNRVEAAYHIEIYSVIGLRVVNIPGIKDNCAIDIGKLSDGIYLLRLINESGKTIEKKFIKE